MFILVFQTEKPGLPLYRITIVNYNDMIRTLALKSREGDAFLIVIVRIFHIVLFSYLFVFKQILQIIVILFSIFEFLLKLCWNFQCYVTAGNILLTKQLNHMVPVHYWNCHMIITWRVGLGCVFSVSAKSTKLSTWYYVLVRHEWLLADGVCRIFVLSYIHFPVD